MSQVVDDFLAHHGIKGMRWGVRRSDPGGDSGGTTVVKLPKGHGLSSRADLTNPAHPLHGAGLTVVSGKGTKRSPLVVAKLSEHASGAKHPSVDAERFVKTTQKHGSEMSDREIKEAVQRANMVESYNKLFSPDSNKELRTKVESLRLDKEFRTLHQQLHPSASSRIARFIATTGTHGFKAYQILNKETNGELNKHILTRLGLDKHLAAHVSNAKASTPTIP